MPRLKYGSIQTDPEVSSFSEFPQPVDVLLGVDARQVTSENLTLLLGAVPRQPL